MRPFKTLTTSAYYISVFSIEFKKIGVEDVTLSLKTDGSLIYFSTITTLVSVNV